jgi:hypothetical protein
MKSNSGFLRISELVVAIFLAGAAMAQMAIAVSIPPGTQIPVNITEKLDSGVVKSGQTFSGTLVGPVVVNGRTVFPRGTPVSGRVVQAISSGRLKKPASLTLQLTQVGGSSISTDQLRIDGKSHLVRNAEFIGGGTAIGAIIGAIAGGEKGAAIGAAAGAGAGTAGAFLTGKKEIAIPSEAVLIFVTPGGNVSPATTTTTRRTEPPQPPPNPPNTPEARRDYPGEYSRQPYFSDGDQRLVRRYYTSNTANLPPGLAKRGGDLPPGLERQLERNGTLPPGLQKRVEPFPEDLNRQLPRLPTGFSRVFIGTHAIIIDSNYRILDLMSFSREGEGEGKGKGHGRGHGHGHDDDRD